MSTTHAADGGSGLPAPGLPTVPPPGALLPERHSDAPEPGSVIASHYAYCFGCGERVDHGLHIEVRAGDGLRVHGTFEVTEHHQGAPGLAHGGLLAAAFDEVLGAVNWLLLSPAVTGRIEVDFRRPVPVGSVLRIDAEITGAQGRKIFTRATGRLGGPDGPVALTAAALFVQVDVSHFTNHGRKEDLERAASDRSVSGSLEKLDLNP